MCPGRSSVISTWARGLWVQLWGLLHSCTYEALKLKQSRGLRSKDLHDTSLTEAPCPTFASNDSTLFQKAGPQNLSCTSHSSGRIILCSAGKYALLDLPFFQFTEDLGLSYVEGEKNKWNTYSGIGDYCYEILCHISFPVNY